MKNFLLILSALFVLSCSSNDDGSDEPQISQDPEQLIIGRWLIVSESDYFCNSDRIANERTSDPGNTIEYYTDGTYQSYTDGVSNNAEDKSGRWEYMSGNDFRHYYTVSGDPRTEQVYIDFIDDNTFIEGDPSKCFNSIYTTGLYVRR